MHTKWDIVHFVSLMTKFCVNILSLLFSSRKFLVYHNFIIRKVCLRIRMFFKECPVPLYAKGTFFRQKKKTTQKTSEFKVHFSLSNNLPLINLKIWKTAYNIQTDLHIDIENVVCVEHRTLALPQSYFGEDVNKLASQATIALQRDQNALQHQTIAP